MAGGTCGRRLTIVERTASEVGGSTGAAGASAPPLNSDVRHRFLAKTGSEEP